MMEDASDVRDLRERDLRLYGNPDGPTFDQLIQENLERGFRTEEIYERIIAGAQTSNREVDKLFEAKRRQT